MNPGLNKTQAEQSLGHLASLLDESFDAAMCGDLRGSANALTLAQNELRILARAIGCRVDPVKRTEAAE